MLSTAVPVFSSRGTDHRDEKGVALVVAMIVVVMVTMLGAVAVSQAIEGYHTSGVTAKGLQSDSAARAGVDSLVADVANALSNGQDVTCQSLSSSFNAGETAVNAASGEGYTLWYYYLQDAGPPSTATLSALATQALDVADGRPNPGTPGWECTTGSTTVLSAATLSTLTSTQYIAVGAIGTSTSVANGWSQAPEVAVVEVSPDLYNFTDGVYGGVEINTPGNLQLTGSGPTYTNGAIDCGSTNDYYSGDVWALGGVTSGACQIRGNLFVSGSLTMNGCSAPDVTGGVYATGSVTLEGGCEVEGDVVSNGNVDYGGGAWNLGNIYAFGPNTTALPDCSGTNTSVCLDSGKNPESTNVYSASGLIDVKNAPISGSANRNTPWPTCPPPVSSGVSCSGGDLAP